MRTAVITTVHGRGAHLRRQRAGLAGATARPDLHVIVAMDDPDVSADLGDVTLPTTVVECPTEPGALPLARARNIGAATALADGAGLLIFLDVDCIPGASLVQRYRVVAGQPEHTGALLCGPVSYLPPPGPTGYPSEGLDRLAQPHPARPAPPADVVLPGGDYELFWSLSFAVTPLTWCDIGGFCEEYVGYGGEDTDFAQTAAERRIPLRWVGGAEAFHQHHPVSVPPVEHLHDIVRNARIFQRRWGWVPMAGWLDEFEAGGLITRDAAGRPQLIDDDARLGRSETGTPVA
ncbi:glycosyltransferase family 2 protein [Mycolicibacterium bacteremicum]|uniref:Sugar transferase n=1 Tax=Mycolicibacterium bacteremicum TaxID=564198 RepID=A0A1W9Z1K8_MYCBA|nr:galactosyltransferase-related protein [Mycolicibacterium bacteremicum]MCV7432310.1 glycosyltransferase family 2 protein [Mycolicibacterium bacteremicum]ORA06147.1 sugar transferase [Mycolicibacterium bacteremicum]